MKSYQLLCVVLLDVLIDNFDVVDYQKTATFFDIWLDEKKVLMREDKKNSYVISHGFGDYRFIGGPIRGLQITYMCSIVYGLTRIPFLKT